MVATKLAKKVEKHFQKEAERAYKKLADAGWNQKHLGHQGGGA